MDHSSESSSERSSSSETNSDIQDRGGDYNDENIIQPYSFEPVDETVSDADIEAKCRQEKLRRQNRKMLTDLKI